MRENGEEGMKVGNVMICKLVNFLIKGGQKIEKKGRGGVLINSKHLINLELYTLFLYQYGPL